MNRYENNVRKYCKYFENGEDNFCINYFGCKRVPESCGRYCDKYKEITICEDKKD